MAATPIISDSEAKRIAERFAGGPNDRIGRLARTGEIAASFQDLHGVDRGDMGALVAYVFHHGVRGPVDGWEAI